MIEQVLQRLAARLAKFRIGQFFGRLSIHRIDYFAQCRVV